MISIKIVDGASIELPEGSTAKELAQKLGFTGPHQGLGVSINGKLVDLVYLLKNGDEVRFWHFDDRQGKEIFWHTSAHVLAQAVLRLWPDAKPTIGPPIEEGFYYDFADLHISDTDFEKIEAEVKVIVKENYLSKRELFPTKKEAIAAFGQNPYKREMIEELPEGAEISGYRQGEFFDLCRGPHLPNIGKIKAFKILKLSGAYWRADASREMLTRIYAISYPSREELTAYLHRLEEAKKRDHKILGPKLDLFSLQEEAPGMPFIHPHGMVVWNKLIDYLRQLHMKRGYVEIKTPVMMTKELWEISGHWQNYRHNMYTSKIEEREYAIKPMNCPGCILFYKTQLHSYREFPLRIAEIGHVHRYEASGALSGLFRVRSFHQDDAHIFMRPGDIQQEILNVLNLTDEIYRTFGLAYHLELSTRPDKGTIGTDEDWEIATNGLRNALESSGRPYKVNPGDGAFYGPKIDMHLRDALGRTWQCGTIQLDMALPEKFQLEYTDNDGSRRRPIMIHRAIYGSLERFFGSLIEFYAGKFPLWLSPRQVRLMTVADRHIDYAKELMETIQAAGFLCELDDSQESVGKKVREAQLKQVNYMLTVGDKEVEHRTVALRTRDNVVHGELQLDPFLTTLRNERDNRLLSSPYQS